jgi:hypothetical protein
MITPDHSKKREAAIHMISGFFEFRMSRYDFVFFANNFWTLARFVKRAQSPNLTGDCHEHP